MWHRQRHGRDSLHTLLSFPPEARSWWSVLHLSPQTSCLCPWSRRSDWRGGALMSRCRITRSRLPDDSWSAFHARAPGSREWRPGEMIHRSWMRDVAKQLRENKWSLNDCLHFHRLSTYPLWLCVLLAQRASSLLLHPRFVHSLCGCLQLPGYPKNRQHTLKMTLASRSLILQWHKDRSKCKYPQAFS